MAVLNQEDARAIARKLKAKILTGRGAHDVALVYHDGAVVARFGIRRGKKDLGHDHVMANIFLSPRNARRLASCPMSREEWIELISKKRSLRGKTARQAVRTEGFRGS